jgi:hypothetical protein
LFLVVSCSSIPDKPFFVDLRPGAGFGVYLISGKKFEVDDAHPFKNEDGKMQTWYDMQLGMIKIPLETFKALKKYFITECKRSSKCSDNIDSWDRNLSALELVQDPK